MQMNLQLKSVVEICRLNLQLKSYMKWMGPGFVPVPCCLRAPGGQVLYAQNERRQRPAVPDGRDHRMNRRGIREQVFKLLFRAEFNTPDQMEEQARFFFDSGDFTATPADEKAIIEKTRKIMDKIPELDQMIGSGLKGWRLDRVGKVELAILRLAVYEICFDDDVPAGAAINEAVELAKKFGQDNAGQFVNGVLAQFAAEK